MKETIIISLTSALLGGGVVYCIQLIIECRQKKILRKKIAVLITNDLALINTIIIMDAERGTVYISKIEKLLKMMSWFQVKKLALELFDVATIQDMAHLYNLIEAFYNFPDSGSKESTTVLPDEFKILIEKVNKINNSMYCYINC